MPPSVPLERLSEIFFEAFKPVLFFRRFTSCSDDQLRDRALDFRRVEELCL